jgi:hypothetical protein
MWTFGNITRCQRASLPAGVSLALLFTGSIAESANPPRVPTIQTQAKIKPRPTADGSKKKKSEIPYDAFFDNPLEVADDKTTVASAPAATTKEPAGATDKPMNDAPAASGGGSSSWSEMFPMENLQTEVKKIQNRLKASLQGQGTYNGNYKDIAVDGSVMAAMAGLAIEHSGDVTCKKNAPLIRDFGHELAQSATGLGKENYEKSKAAYEKMDSVFGGAIPADAPKSPASKRPFNETADRDGLMKRIEKARNHLRDNINTEAKLKSDTESIVHETLIISTLGKIVATEGYSSADEADYQQFADALINGAKDATTAAKDQSFQKFTDSMNKVNKSCDQCHANYGNG